MQWECVHIYREANQAPDLLSDEAIKKKSGGGLNPNFRIFKGTMLWMQGGAYIKVGKPIPT